MVTNLTLHDCNAFLRRQHSPYRHAVHFSVFLLGLLTAAVFAAFSGSAQAEPRHSADRVSEVPANGYLVEEINEGLYWVTDGVYQTMFLTTGKGVIVVDAPPTIGANLLKAIVEVTDEPITHLIYSHSHRDHIGAAGLFPEGITIIAHEETAMQLARAFVEDLPPPTVTFADRYSLAMGNQVLELEYRGPHHEPGNIYVYAPRQKVLLLIDVIFPGWVPFKNLALAEDVPGYIQAHDEVLSYDFKTFIGGHVNRLGKRKDVKMARQYINEVRGNAAEALATVDIGAIAEIVGTDNPWLLFDTWMDAVAQSCERLTLATWRHRLKGVEVFTEDHCWVMAQSLRID